MSQSTMLFVVFVQYGRIDLDKIQHGRVDLDKISNLKL